MGELARDLLNVWERGLPASAVERGLLLLSIPLPGQTFEQLARIRIGDRDAELLAFRERAFGSHMTGRVTCPVCSSELELEFDTGRVRVEPSRAAVSNVVAVDGYEVTIRSLDSTDLGALSSSDDLPTNAHRLLCRSVVTARFLGEETDADALPAPVVACVSERLSAADPQSDGRISAECPECVHVWDAPLDIASYMWTEVHTWACRTLRDIHDLASAYGWREGEILALSPARRQIYLDLIRS